MKESAHREIWEFLNEIDWPQNRLPLTLEEWCHLEVHVYGTEEQEFRLRKDRPCPLWIPHEIARIGTSGWDWRNKISVFIGFDIDGTTGHKAGHADAVLHDIAAHLSLLPYVGLRRSKGGQGMHAFVWTDRIPANDPDHHSLNGGAILAKMSEDIGIDLRPLVDVYGGIMWIASIDAAVSGFEVISEATVKLRAADLPPVERPISGRRSHDRFDGVTTEPLLHHPIHDLIIEATRKHGLAVPAGDLFHVHTEALKRGLNDIGIKDAFEIESNASRLHEKNGWLLFHNEKATVGKFPQGKKSTFELKTTFDAACGAAGGTFVQDDEYSFPDTEKAKQALTVLWAALPDTPDNREVSLIRSGNQVTACIDKNGKPDRVAGYGGRPTARDQRVTMTISESWSVDISNLTDFVRSSCDEGWSDIEWHLWTQSGKWLKTKSTTDVDAVLTSKGYKPPSRFRGKLLDNPYVRVGVHYGEEYTSEREWNLNGATLPVHPEAGEHPHYDLILSHLGTSLDSGTEAEEWCRVHGVNGASYLLYWIALILQSPYQTLPMLAFWSWRHGTGKSMFILLLRRIFPDHTVDMIRAITENHNGQCAYAIIGILEERDVAAIEQASSKLRDLITSSKLSIRDMHRTQFEVRNSLHLVQTANDPNFIPVDPGDRRIVVSDDVPPISHEIPEMDMLSALDRELPAFLNTCLNTVVPECPTQLRLPTLTTQTKRKLMEGKIEKPKIAESKEGHSAGEARQPSSDFDRQVLAAIEANGAVEFTASDLKPYIPDPEASAERIGKALSRLNYPKCESRRRYVRH